MEETLADIVLFGSLRQVELAVGCATRIKRGEGEGGSRAGGRGSGGGGGMGGGGGAAAGAGGLSAGLLASDASGQRDDA
jgi:hypothetical protein